MTYKICVQTNVFGNYMSLSWNREKLESEIPAYMYVKKISKLFVETGFNRMHCLFKVKRTTAMNDLSEFSLILIYLKILFDNCCLEPNNVYQSPRSYVL